MIAFNDGWESEPPISDDMAKKLLLSMFHAKSSPPPPPTALHIGEYIDYMMNEQGYQTLALTVQKDEASNLVFNIHYKEK